MSRPLCNKLFSKPSTCSRQIFTVFLTTNKKLLRRNYSSHKGHIFRQKLADNFQLQLGGILPQVDVIWEINGPDNAETVMIIPALSASSHICSNASEPKSGWWEDMVGPGKWINTNKWKVICAAILAWTADLGLYRWRYGVSFPQITTLDQARVHKLVLDYLNIDNIHAVIGSSLEAVAHTSPGTVAIRRIQRLSVMSDPNYHNGRYYEHNTWPTHGMKVARTVGLLSYRSVTEFNDRFGWKPQPPYDARAVTFEVEKWLHEKTEPFSSTYDPNCYLLLSRCMDLMDVGMTWPSHAEALKRVKAKSLVLGANTDTLIYPKEQIELYNHLRKAKVDAELEIMTSKYGHDAFLHDIDLFGLRIKSFLDS